MVFSRVRGQQNPANLIVSSRATAQQGCKPAAKATRVGGNKR
jgi:hypothetical protein